MNKQVNPNRKVKRTNLILAFLIAFLFLPGNAAQAKSTNQWDIAWDSLDMLHDDLSLLKTALNQQSAAITELRKKNNAALKAVNDKIKVIDQAQITRLTSEVQQTEQKHAPLLAQYAAYSKQAADAKKRKNIKTADLLDLKRNQLKDRATAARGEIAAKKSALALAKKQASSKKKLIQNSLVPVQALKKQITAGEQDNCNCEKESLISGQAL